MFDQLKRNILTTKELIGVKDEAAFFEAIHQKAGAPKEIKSLSSGETKFLREKHEEYVKKVSSPEMAASFELCGLLYKLATTLPLKNTVDLGAGFSSYVLRLASLKTSNFNVYSVDDDAKWLEKTRTYLKENNSPGDRLFELKEFEHQTLPEFDLVLLDLNFVEVRKNYIESSIQILAKNGIIIFDDTHKIEYLREVKEKCDKHQVQLFNFRNSTLDHFKRFALIGLK